MNNREIYWIKFYNARDRNIGYNIGLGGDGGDTYSCLTSENLAEIKSKISKSVLKSIKDGRMTPPDTKKEKNGMWGKTHTDEVKEKLRKRLKGKTLEEIHGEEEGKKLREKFRKIRKGVNNPSYGKSPMKKECEFCKKQIDVRNFNRWHGEKCKLKENETK